MWVTISFRPRPRMRCYHGPTMRILAIDVGTGTQDILLFDSGQPIENALQLIMPSPTQIAAGRIRRATEGGRPVFLTGVTAGGGPCHWVVEAQNDLRAFAFLPGELPAYLTRARTLLASVDVDAPLVFLDTGPAAALGALQDPLVAQGEEQLVLNLGNMHALAFHLQGTRVLSLYEHHTGEVTSEQIEDFTERLLAGTLAHEEIFGSKGHGAYYADGTARENRNRKSERPIIAVTGPQRRKLRGSRLAPYFAAPHGH